MYEVQILNILFGQVVEKENLSAKKKKKRKVEEVDEEEEEEPKKKKKKVSLVTMECECL